jgi:hypothetical protein
VDAYTARSQPSAWCAHDREDFLAAEEIEAVPPAFELQESIVLALGLCEQAVVFLKNTLGPQGFEVLHQPGAVEAAGPQIGEPVPVRRRGEHAFRARRCRSGQCAAAGSWTAA